MNADEQAIPGLIQAWLGGFYMARAVVTQLMFEGTAEQAMNLYVSLFKGSEITRMERYGSGEPGAEDSVKRAEFTLAGHRLA